MMIDFFAAESLSQKLEPRKRKQAESYFVSMSQEEESKKPKNNETILPCQVSSDIGNSVPPPAPTEEISLELSLSVGGSTIDRFTPKKALKQAKPFQEKVPPELRLTLGLPGGYGHNGDQDSYNPEPRCRMLIKILTKSDIGDHSRLLLPKNYLEKHVFRHLDQEFVEKLRKSTCKWEVVVYDKDNNTEHNVVFKRWKSSKGYVFNKTWVNDFVKRRNLKEKDKIGLYWDESRERFVFTASQSEMEAGQLNKLLRST